MLYQLVLSAGALCVALTAVWKFPPARRALSWVWRRNVTEPLVTKADALITAVVVRELKSPNGGNSIPDVANQIHRLQATTDMNGEQLQDVRRLARDTAAQLTEHLRQNEDEP